ncbi:MAG TPA: hypothetical protein VGI88_06570 [Verrucomicrobiae bacterium]
MKALSYLGAVLLFFASQAIAADNRWTIHEWGTFTSLQNESGDALGGINTDDEPVPQFVHRLSYGLLLPPTEIPASFGKGIPVCHPDVNMRLETPVIYFHPPASQTGIQKINVAVEFRGGWLTEFYPDAKASAPGFVQNHIGSTVAFSATGPLGPISRLTKSELKWNDLCVGGDWSFTNTTEHVWTSPRAVKAASVQTASAESEKFLFYRGIGHIDAPLRVARDANTGELLFRSQLEELPGNQPLPIRAMWLVDIQPNGKLAFRALPSISLDHNSKKILAHTRADFDSTDYSESNLEKLETSLRTALVDDGLFTDEAQALLNTWELSYFKSPGVRVFFLVPRAWTDSVLPLQVSQPAQINRVMVGRIELVTPEQRNNLRELGRFSFTRVKSDAVDMQLLFSNALRRDNGATWTQLTSGRTPLSATISVPKTYQTYLDLGRFRNALILDEAAHHPTPSLTNFIATYRLQAFKPVATVDFSFK